MIYVKIDRVAGAIIGRQHFDEPERALHKPHVWLPYIDLGAPAHNPATQDLTHTEVIPDLSDLTVDVPESAVVDVQYSVTDLSQAEIDTRVEADAEQAFDEMKIIKAVAIWNAQKHGVSLSQARDEIKAIYKGL